MKIAITTPTGKVGSKITNILLNEGRDKIVLLARHAGKLQDERSLGAIVREGTQTDEDYVMYATEDVDVLFWVIPPNYRSHDPINFYHEVGRIGAKAVKENRISQAVLLSSIGAHLGHGVGPVNGFKKVEEMFREATGNLRILRPAYFMENFLATVDGIAQANSVFLPIHGEATAPMIATKDIADVAVTVLASQFNGTQVMPLHGPRDYSFNEAAEIIGKALGREVNHVKISLDQAKEAMVGMGMSDAVAEAMIEMHVAIETGHMSAEYPRTPDTTTPTTLEEIAQTVIAPAVEAKTGANA
jgi:uncharacterized protein YbjT (DUF2867 family)